MSVGPHVFRVGDEVQLTGGGPRMAVTAVEWRSGVQVVSCSWFEGAVVKTGEFAHGSLKPADPSTVVLPPHPDPPTDPT